MLLVSFASVERILDLPKNMFLSNKSNEGNKLDLTYKLPRLVE
jgi:hypothetical protein